MCLTISYKNAIFGLMLTSPAKPQFHPRGEIFALWYYVFMKNFALWENDEFEVVTPKNPHIPPEEGFQLVILTKHEIIAAWSDPDLSAKAFHLSARVCQILEEMKLAPWFNIQANGNWGLLPGTTPRFHIHIYARLKGKTWGQPVQLPLAPKTYTNSPISEDIRNLLTRILRERL